MQIKFVKVDCSGYNDCVVEEKIVDVVSIDSFVEECGGDIIEDEFRFDEYRDFDVEFDYGNEYCIGLIKVLE